MQVSQAKKILARVESRLEVAANPPDSARTNWRPEIKTDFTLTYKGHTIYVSVSNFSYFTRYDGSPYSNEIGINIALKPNAPNAERIFFTQPGKWASVSNEQLLKWAQKSLSPSVITDLQKQEEDLTKVRLQYQKEAEDYKTALQQEIKNKKAEGYKYAVDVNVDFPAGMENLRLTIFLKKLPSDINKYLRKLYPQASDIDASPVRKL